jgi:cytochrome c5
LAIIRAHFSRDFHRKLNVKQLLAVIVCCAAVSTFVEAFAETSVQTSAEPATGRVPPGTNDDIRARTQPVGELCKAGQACGAAVAASAGGAARSGDAVYNQFCFACHSTGVGGAPKVHNVAEWAPHLAKGNDVVWTSVTKGLNAMPPKGTCMNCSDDELHAAIAFMSKAQ